MAQNKLTKAEATQLRYEYANGTTIDELKVKYSISKSLAYEIINNTAKAYIDKHYISPELKEELVNVLYKITGISRHE